MRSEVLQERAEGLMSLHRWEDDPDGAQVSHQNCAHEPAHTVRLAGEALSTKKSLKRHFKSTSQINIKETTDGATVWTSAGHSAQTQEPSLWLHQSSGTHLEEQKGISGDGALVQCGIQRGVELERQNILQDERVVHGRLRLWLRLVRSPEAGLSTKV